MKSNRWPLILRGASVIFGWSCWVLAYVQSNLWWIPVSIIPYILCNSFFPREDPTDDGDNHAP
ncbi:hypothetical protein M4R22_05295 [Acidovorax sp. GBBC 3334]|uniref:hypothetical protein n=1 Tax=unclassified Acidovorax TaxID=2684926 RepID=UPI0023046977|nr:MULTISPECIES: hypothetical protein [unclassified Acidovorax]MDA8454171.1 hypothetical protein [Acidovorax sp. GBBC 3334]